MWYLTVFSRRSLNSCQFSYNYEATAGAYYNDAAITILTLPFNVYCKINLNKVISSQGGLFSHNDRQTATYQINKWKWNIDLNLNVFIMWEEKKKRKDTAVFRTRAPDLLPIRALNLVCVHFCNNDWPVVYYHTYYMAT